VYGVCRGGVTKASVWLVTVPCNYEDLELCDLLICWIKCGVGRILFVFNECGGEKRAAIPQR